PVIAGNRTSLPEVVGDAGLLFDPFDVSAMTAALARIIDDAELRRALRVKGLERAKLFDWRKTAQMTLKIYEQAAQSAKRRRRKEQF
ncbi:MAG: hypothetical protein WCB68_10390, partial [Pyrinomonadaceae bacterium]